MTFLYTPGPLVWVTDTILPSIPVVQRDLDRDRHKCSVELEAA